MFASEFKHQINTLTSQTIKPEGEQGHCIMPYEHTWRAITNHRALPEPGPSHRWALTSRSCCRNSLPSTNGLKIQARRVPHSQLGVALNATSCLAGPPWRARQGCLRDILTASARLDRTRHRAQSFAEELLSEQLCRVAFQGAKANGDRTRGWFGLSA